MTQARERPYHHGQLRRAVLDAAVHQVETVGAANLSMREIARLAGVSHAAPAHHFKDKAGIFTAIAVEGFQLITAAISPVAGPPDGFLQGGLAYVQFAIEHPGHFDVMFRPDLYRLDDPQLVEARDAAFRLLHDTARAALGADPTEREVTGLVVAGWSLTHGFATLWLNANLQDRVGDDPAAFAAAATQGVVTLGEVTRRQLGMPGSEPGT
jgi:AcrR family transcriptional regulator